MRPLGTITGEGFISRIIEYRDGRVEFDADADIDADGANGQNGERPAYMRDDSGSEALANGGMGIDSGRVVCTSTWCEDIVITDSAGRPRVFDGGVVASRTSYRFPHKSPNDPSAYVDSETVPYIVVPPLVIMRTAGAVMGCRAIAWNLEDRTQVEGVVADAGPRTKVGEVSIAMARLLGIDPSPRSGGTNLQIIRYELWPGKHGRINGQLIALQRSNGEHINVV